ncbi:MAG: diguanylate cyclase [Nitrospira sp.]|nr:diguanylate cyclase [Nitrospira sp.]
MKISNPPIPPFSKGGYRGNLGYKMEKKVKCWEVFACKEKECPAYKSKDLKCWLFSRTHCRDEIQGKYLEKMAMCLDCEVFKANMDVSSMKETIEAIDKQFKEFASIVEERDKELEDISMELSVGLSEVLEALNKIASGDPRVRIPEDSKHELIAKLKQTVNKTAGEIGIIVDQSHEFAIGLAEHFDILHRVAKGELSARIPEVSQDELLKALGNVTNQMIESVAREITKRKNAEDELRKKSERESLILRSVPIAFYTAKASGDFGRIWISEQVKDISGFPPNKFIDDSSFWSSRIYPDDRDQVLMEFETIHNKGTIALEYRWQCADGSYYWFRDLAVLVRDEQGKPKEIIGTWRDITDRKQAEERLRTMSLIDDLTGIYNRRGFFTLAEQQIKIANRMKRGMFLLFTDLDGLKAINDTLGHHEGDLALIDTANILKDTFRESDIIARIGGDEFVALIIEPSNGAQSIGPRLKEKLDFHNTKMDRPYNISLSIGLAQYNPEQPCTIDDLLSMADKLMYEQKQKKHNP